MEKHMMSGELDPAYTKYSCGLQTPIWKVAESAKQDTVSFITFLPNMNFRRPFWAILIGSQR